MLPILPVELPVGSDLAHLGRNEGDNTGQEHAVILRIQKWGPGRLIGFAAAVFLLASVIAIGSSALILEKSVQADDNGRTVFVSFEGHPECGAVLEYVNSEDLEAGEVVSGDAAPCESRNLIIRLLQVVSILALLVVLFYVAGTWLVAQGKDDGTPDPV